MYDTSVNRNIKAIGVSSKAQFACTGINPDGFFIGDSKMEKRNYTKHNMTGTKLHEVWKEMRRRCKDKNPKSTSYKKRNITVCEEWEKAIVFLQWALLNGYREGLQIDRIDNDKGYSPDNCRWVTPKQNANNKANTRFLTLWGKRRTILEWSIITGINRRTIYTRWRRNWNVQRILTKGAKSEVNYGQK